MILFTTCPCYRELASPAALGASGGSPTSFPVKSRQSGAGGGGGGGGGGGSGSGNGSGSGSGSGGSGSGASKGEFDPCLETVKAARSCSSIIAGLLTSPASPPPLFLPAVVPSATVHECVTLSARASMTMDVTSSTAFGEAVREALVRSIAYPPAAGKDSTRSLFPRLYMHHANTLKHQRARCLYLPFDVERFRRGP